MIFFLSSLLHSPHRRSITSIFSTPGRIASISSRRYTLSSALATSQPAFLRSLSLRLETWYDLLSLLHVVASLIVAQIVEAVAC
jgi:pyrroline-5-carboxylate reductase